MIPARIGEMLCALDNPTASAGRLEPSDGLGVLVRSIHQVRVPLTFRPVVHAWDVIVPKPVDMVFRDQVLVEAEEVIARECLPEIRSSPVLKELSLEAAEHRVRLTRRFIDHVVGELRVRVRVYGVEDHGDTLFMRRVHETLERERAAQALVGREVVEWRIAPLHRFLHVRDGHQLEDVHAETY